MSRKDEHTKGARVIYRGAVHRVLRGYDGVYELIKVSTGQVVLGVWGSSVGTLKSGG